MSTTTARGGIDFAEQITRINNLQADTALKLAQAAKNQADTKWAGWQVAFAGFTSGAAVIGAIVALMKVLG
jgi:hypothetical protein